MRTKAMIFLAAIAATALAACAVVMDEGDPALIEQGYDTAEQSLSSDDPVTEAAKDCYVSIQCANGTSRACNGTSGSCSASGAGNGSVTCNGVTNACPIPPPPSECSSCPPGYDCHCGIIEGCIRQDLHCP